MLCCCVEAELSELRVEEAKRLSEGFQGFSFGRSLTPRVKDFFRHRVGRSLYWNGAWAILLSPFGSDLGWSPQVRIR